MKAVEICKKGIRMFAACLALSGALFFGISDTASAPAASTACAIYAMSVTFGLSFMTTGCFAAALTAFVIAAAAFGSCPKAMPPSFTFGQEILISSRSTGWSERRSTTST